jgi:transposase
MSAMISTQKVSGQRRTYWQGQLAAWLKSGLTQTEFCRRQKISVAALGWWKARFARAAKDSGFPGPSAGRFVEVKMTESRAGGRWDFSYEVVLANGRSVRVGAGFDDEQVGRLIRVAEVAGC